MRCIGFETKKKTREYEKGANPIITINEMGKTAREHHGTSAHTSIDFSSFSLETKMKMGRITLTANDRRARETVDTHTHIYIHSNLNQMIFFLVLFIICSIFGDSVFVFSVDFVVSLVQSIFLICGFTTSFFLFGFFFVVFMRQLKQNIRNANGPICVFETPNLNGFYNICCTEHFGFCDKNPFLFCLPSNSLLLSFSFPFFFLFHSAVDQIQ